MRFRCFRACREPEVAYAAHVRPQVVVQGTDDPLDRGAIVWGGMKVFTHTVKRSLTSEQVARTMERCQLFAYPEVAAWMN